MIEENENSRRTAGKRKKKAVVAGVLAVVMLIAVIATGCGGGNTEIEMPSLKFSTPYIDLMLPLELEDLITSEEGTNGNVYTCAFYLHYEEEEIPLWRFDFGDSNAGDWVGVLKTAEGDIPVVMTGFAVTDEQLATLGEDGSRMYGECMQGYSMMLESIMSDPRFTAERPLAVGDDTDMELTYWKVSLPDTMEVLESTENGSYEAVFSGKVAGEIVDLYRVCIGEEQALSFLGYYEVDGVMKAVSVESFDLTEQDDWSEDDYATAYRMMETINHVIETILQSKQFSVEQG